MAGDDLGAWIEARALGAVRSLRRAVSATDLVHGREAFGMEVRPVPGSVLASARQTAWDPEPDYFYHWLRDAAVVMRVLPAVLRRADAGEAGWWRRAFADHVQFSLAISDPDAQPLAGNPWRTTTRREALRFLRPDAELRALTGEARLAEPRVGADGRPDCERWGRPQHDGPALRAATCLDVTARAPGLGGPPVESLLARDLAFCARVAGAPANGPWEEAPPRRHAFMLIAQWDALERGARWRASRGEGREAALLAAGAARAAAALERACDTAEGGWRDSVEAGPGEYDASAVLAILHAGRRTGPLAPHAPRTLASVAALERRFADLYPINRGRPVPAIGRWAGDVYFGGNPWYPVTLGFAELHYAIAAAGGSGARDAFAKAEAWMALIREVAPAGDALPEQFDRTSGAPVSCLALSWSAAAFLGAAEARLAALQTAR